MPDIYELIGEYGYLVLFLTLFVEGLGIPGVPFEPLFILTGLMVNAGTLDIRATIFYGALGGTFGNLCGYLLGRLGRRLVQKPDQPRRKWSVPRNYITVAQRWFGRLGPSVVFFARWFGPIRTPIILGAGLVGMPFWQYGLFSFLTALVWNAAWQILTWKFGKVIMACWERGKPWAVLATVVVVLGWLLYRRALRSQPNPLVPEGSTPAPAANRDA